MKKKRMTAKRASAIMAHMMQWHFYTMGITETAPPFMDYGLREMLAASDKVSTENDKARANRKDGESISQQLTMADRGIAAMYVAMNYEPNEDAIICVNNRLTAVVALKHD